MSSTTTNLGLVKMASGETIGQWSDANNGSGANLDKIDTAIGNLNSQLFTNKDDTSLINLVKTFGVGTYNFRLDTATEAPTSGGIVYKVVKTHGANDTRCVITAIPMATDGQLYSAFVGQNATNISWTRIMNTRGSNLFAVGANQSATLPITGFGVWLLFRSYSPNIIFVRENGEIEAAVGNASHISTSISNGVLTVTNLLSWPIMILAFCY